MHDTTSIGAWSSEPPVLQKCFAATEQQLDVWQGLRLQWVGHLMGTHQRCHEECVQVLLLEIRRSDPFAPGRLGRESPSCCPAPPVSGSRKPSLQRRLVPCNSGVLQARRSSRIPPHSRPSSKDSGKPWAPPGLPPSHGSRCNAFQIRSCRARRRPAGCNAPSSSSPVAHRRECCDLRWCQLGSPVQCAVLQRRHVSTLGFVDDLRDQHILRVGWTSVASSTGSSSSALRRCRVSISHDPGATRAYTGHRVSLEWQSAHLLTGYRLCRGGHIGILQQRAEPLAGSTRGLPKGCTNASPTAAMAETVRWFGPSVVHALSASV